MQMERARPLIASAYVVAFIMAAIAVADILGRLLPTQMGETAWRIGAVGIITLSVPTLLLALLITSLTAWYLEHRIFLRVVAVLSLVGAVALLGVLPFFAVDLLEMRGLVPAEGRRGFDMAMARAGLTVLGAAAALGWMSYAGWKATRKRTAEVRAEARKQQAGVLVSQPR
jgi:MFS family permease